MNLRRRKLASVLAAAAATILAVSKANAGQTSPLRFKFADSAVTALQDNCDPSTGLPLPGDGACIGIQSTIGNSSGGLDSTYLSQISFAVLTNGDAPFTAFDTFTGNLKGRGAGSFTVMEVDNITADGKLSGIWNIVEGSGTDKLVGISGWGSLSGTYDPTTILATGTFSGFMHFNK